MHCIKLLGQRLSARGFGRWHAALPLLTALPPCNAPNLGGAVEHDAPAIRPARRERLARSPGLMTIRPPIIALDTDGPGQHAFAGTKTCWAHPGPPIHQAPHRFRPASGLEASLYNTTGARLPFPPPTLVLKLSCSGYECHWAGGMRWGGQAWVAAAKGHGTRLRVMSRRFATRHRNRQTSGRYRVNGRGWQEKSEMRDDVWAGARRISILNNSLRARKVRIFLWAASEDASHARHGC